MHLLHCLLALCEVLNNNNNNNIIIIIIIILITVIMMLSVAVLLMQVYADGVVRRLVDGVASSKASLTTGDLISEYLTTSSSAGVGGGRIVTPLSTPRSSPLAPHGPTAAGPAAAGAAAAGHCRWTHLQQQQQQQQQQQGYQPAPGVLDPDNVDDFALMASLVSATSSSGVCVDDILLKGPP